MERPNAWKKLSPEQLEEVEELAGAYRAFISENKTERECVTASVALAEAAGYADLAGCIERGQALKPGDRVYAVSHKKTLMLAHIGTAPIEKGTNILGAHIDSPRLDLKQNPLYESDGLATITAASRPTTGSPPRSRFTAWSAKRTAPPWRSASARTPQTRSSACPTS